MGFDGWALLAALIRLVALAILSTPATALQSDPADAKPTQESGLCFTTWQKGYTLLGCYERPNSGTGGEVFGDDNTYITLLPVPGNMSTAAACVEGCALAVPKNTTSGDYSYVAVSQGRRCRCGTKLTRQARKVDSALCDVPCSGDSDVSCGGRLGYALVYSLGGFRANTTRQNSWCPEGHDCERNRSRPIPTLSCPTPTAAVTSTSGSQPTASAPSPPGDDNGDDYVPAGALLSSADTKSTVGVVLGSITAAAALLGVAILLIFLCRRRRGAKYDLDADDEPSRTYSQTRRHVRDLTNGRAERVLIRNAIMAQSAPSPGNGVHRVSHVSALTSGSEGQDESRARQEVSPVDTELSNPGSLVVLNASHVMISPVAENASIVDTRVSRESPKRRYSSPVNVRAGFSARDRAN